MDVVKNVVLKIKRQLAVVCFDLDGWIYSNTFTDAHYLPKVQRKFTVTEQELERSDDRCKDLERLVHVLLVFRYEGEGQDNLLLKKQDLFRTDAALQGDCK